MRFLSLESLPQSERGMEQAVIVRCSKWGDGRKQRAGAVWRTGTKFDLGESDAPVEIRRMSRSESGGNRLATPLSLPSHPFLLSHRILFLCRIEIKMLRDEVPGNQR